MFSKIIIGLVTTRTIWISFSSTWSFWLILEIYRDNFRHGYSVCFFWTVSSRTWGYWDFVISSIKNVPSDSFFPEFLMNFVRAWSKILFRKIFESFRFFSQIQKENFGIRLYQSVCSFVLIIPWSGYVVVGYLSSCKSNCHIRYIVTKFRLSIIWSRSDGHFLLSKKSSWHWSKVYFPIMRINLTFSSLRTVMSWTNNTTVFFFSSPTKSNLANICPEIIGIIVMTWTRYISNLKNLLCVRHNFHLSCLDLCQAIRSFVIVFTRSSSHNQFILSILTNYKRFSIMSKRLCWIIRTWSAGSLLLIEGRWPSHSVCILRSLRCGYSICLLWTVLTRSNWKLSRRFSSMLNKDWNSVWTKSTVGVVWSWGKVRLWIGRVVAVMLWQNLHLSTVWMSETVCPCWFVLTGPWYSWNYFQMSVTYGVLDRVFCELITYLIMAWPRWFRSQRLLISLAELPRWGSGLCLSLCLLMSVCARSRY